MRKLLKLCAYGALALTLAPSAFAVEPGIQELRAVEVSYFGGITGFDSAGYRTLKSAIGALVADGTIAQFVTHSVGMEGGSGFCVELNKDPAVKLNEITDVLKSIRPSAVTIYNHQLKLSCSP